MSNKYTEVQEQAIISAMSKSKDFDTMKQNLSDLLKHKDFLGMNIRELLSKALHLSKTSDGKIIYHKKQYIDKTGSTPIRKATLIQQLEVACNFKPGTLESIEPATKLAIAELLQYVNWLNSQVNKD